MRPEDVNERLARAHELLEQGRAADSLRYLDELVESVVDGEERVEAVALRSLALAALDRFDEAISSVESLLEELPNAARLHATRGILLLNRGEMDEARDALETAYQLDQEDELVLANLGTVYDRLGMHRQALDVLNHLIKLGGDIEWTLPRVASLQADLGDTVAARSTLRRYLSVFTDDASAWISLGILHSDDELYEDAFTCYRRAEQIDPSASGLRLNWGVTAVRAGRLPLAREQLTYLQRSEPDTSRPRILRAIISEESGDLRAAEHLYDEALHHVVPGDREELTYSFEMAMDFFARNDRPERCEQLLAQAYAANACTFELCEVFREATGEPVRNGAWFSLIVEADYRPGLEELIRPPDRSGAPFTRFQRVFQIVARDRDEATGQVLQFLRRMGETGATVRGILQEEQVEDEYTGIYEIDQYAAVFSDTQDE